MPTAAEIQAQQFAAQTAAMQAGQQRTTGGITQPYDPYSDPYNTELRRGASNLNQFDAFNQQLKQFNASLDAFKNAGQAAFPTAGAPAATPATPVVDPMLASQRRSAFADFKTILDQWGLGELAGWATALYQSENAPVSFNEFYLQLKQQPVYVERFGRTNDQRIKAGLPALSESAIMGLESQYKKTMASYGLPASFYDQPADFQKFIVNDLSASEVADRVAAADAFVKMQDPTIRKQLASYYGIGDGALVAAQLDPAKGQQIIEQLAAKQTAAIAAGTAGLGVNAAQRALNAGAGALSFGKQAQGFAEAAQMGGIGSNLSAIYGAQGGPQYGTEQAVTEVFGGAGAFQEQEKRRRLAKMEEATFSGSSGVGAGSLGVTNTDGSL